MSSSGAEPRPAAAVEKPPNRLPVPLAIVGVALFIATLDNEAFWGAVLGASVSDAHQAAIVVSMFAMVFCTLTIVLAFAASSRLFKLTATVLLLIAASCGFFMSEYGVVVDVSMIRNVAETDAREAWPLLTSAFFRHLLLFGAMPSLMIILAPLRVPGWKLDIVMRAGMIAVSSFVLLAAFYLNYGPVSFFAQQHRGFRLLMNPAYPIYAYARFLLRAEDEPLAVRIPLAASIAARHDDRQRRTLLIFVMGETARADRFSLNGYSRDTNPYTREYGVISFGRVSSCGTSTADSVPCIFSQLGRADFDHAAAAKQESLFGTLERLGADVAWRDNSTGCKDVCDAEHLEQLADRTDAGLCDPTGCFDEILLEDIDELVADASRDHFIVLHQRGSHGPAYYTDVPSWSKAFSPACDLPNLRNCSLEAINNAYDNTVLYTDFLLSRIIGFLEQQANRYNVAMLYVSDHGESLGEGGLYLHGFPYAIAPQEQIHVPMLFWASAGFYDSNGLDARCLRRSADEPATHDSIFHTLLPLFDIETPGYERGLDLFAHCRRRPDTVASIVSATAAGGSNM